MNKAQQFINELLGTINGIDQDLIKATIGDSTGNNRTISVNQVIRFLRSSGGRRNSALASNLSTAYATLRPTIPGVRAARTSRRTDATDINEFLRLFGVAYVASGSFRRSLGQRLSSF